MIISNRGKKGKCSLVLRTSTPSFYLSCFQITLEI